MLRGYSNTLNGTEDDDGQAFRGNGTVTPEQAGSKRVRVNLSELRFKLIGD